MSWITNLLRPAKPNRGSYTVWEGKAQAEQALRERGVGEAAATKDVPDELAGLHLRRVASMAVLRRECAACGAVVSDAAHAADVSRMVADLRRAAAKQHAGTASAEDDVPPDADVTPTDAASANDTPDAPQSSDAPSPDTPEPDPSDALSADEALAMPSLPLDTDPDAPSPDTPEPATSDALSADEALVMPSLPLDTDPDAPSPDTPEPATSDALSADEALVMPSLPLDTDPDAPSPDTPAVPLMLNIDDAIAAEMPAPAAPPQPEEAPPTAVLDVPAPEEAPANDAPAKPAPAGPLFLLWVDSLTAVPSLATLPGCTPDAVLLDDALLSADEDAVHAACLTALTCAADTLTAEKVPQQTSEDAYNVLHWSVDALNGHTADGGAAARHLLERGLEDGYGSRLTQALKTTYDLSTADAAAVVLPALAEMMGGTAAQVAEALKGLHAPTTLPCLRLMDIPHLAQHAAKATVHPAKRLTIEQLAHVLRSLYVSPEAPLPVEALIPRQQAFFDTGRTLDVGFRLHQLDALSRWIDRHESDILQALLSDLGKCAFEAYETEILLVKDELKTMRRHLPRWQRDHHVHAPLMHFFSRCFTVRQPYGRALIMSPWNYPFLLSVDPLLAAIGGGNCVVLKPSAYAPATSQLLSDMVGELYDPEYVAVVQGGRAENQSLLGQKFDTIFFTGSVEVGKLVMKSAAEHLTPVTLELGGKSPCIVDETADVALAARRIAWGKFVNAGQTCVAPDYVLCHASVAEKFLAEMEKAIRALYGEDPTTNTELCHIVNEKHFHRLLGLMDGADIAVGGRSLPETLRIEPTVLRNVSWDDPVMQEEVFGPILPVLTWEGDFTKLLSRIEDRPRPLAAYLFTRSKVHEEAFLRRLRFGGGCINDVLCHLATTTMPFGGVGESGMGSYHGRRSFDTFTHEKSILKKALHPDVKMRYAPYKEKLKWLRRLG